MADKQPIVYIVDDDEAVLKSLTMLMNSIDVTSQTFTGCTDFLAAYDPSQGGCLLVDVRMPGMSGLELQKKLLDMSIDIPVIIISGHGDVPTAVEAMKAGAIDFIEKPFRDQALIDAVNKAINLDAQRRADSQMRRSYLQKRASLTPREAQIMDMLVAGRANKEIAHALGISIKTVDYHRLNMMDKMGVDSVVKLTRLSLSLPETQGVPG